MTNNFYYYIEPPNKAHRTSLKIARDRSVGGHQENLRENIKNGPQTVER